MYAYNITLPSTHIFVKQKKRARTKLMMTMINFEEWLVVQNRRPTRTKYVHKMNAKYYIINVKWTSTENFCTWTAHHENKEMIICSSHEKQDTCKSKIIFMVYNNSNNHNNICMHSYLVYFVCYWIAHCNNALLKYPFHSRHWEKCESTLITSTFTTILLIHPVIVPLQLLLMGVKIKKKVYFCFTF